MTAEPRARSSQSDVVTAEHELMLLLCGTLERRERGRERILELSGVVDAERLAHGLAEQGLLPLLGHRLADVARPSLARQFLARVDEAVQRGRRRALLYEPVTARVANRLERAGIATLVLKGAPLGQAIYGDPGLRTMSDIDLLVPRQVLGRAASELEQDGYRLAQGDLRAAALPHLHYGFVHPQGWPPVELHWRVHWYEERFSSAVLDRSRTESGGLRRASAPDELAMLLLFYARDGFVGLRYAADIAAWWDVYGASLRPRALEPIAERHPPLRRVLLAAAAQVDRLVGVPAARLLSVPRALERRSLLALRLVNWSHLGDRDQVASNRVLVDWLLSPEGGQRDFARRFLLPSSTSIVRYEHMPEYRRPSRIVWRLTHGPKLILRSLYAVWSLRGGRDWSPLPSGARWTTEALGGEDSGRARPLRAAPASPPDRV